MRRTLTAVLIGAFRSPSPVPLPGSARPVVAARAATAAGSGSASLPDPFVHRDEGRVLDPHP